MILHRDTAGQERYASLAPLYYRGASAAAVVFDVTSPESFAKAQHWVKELQKNAGGDIGARSDSLSCCVLAIVLPLVHVPPDTTTHDRLSSKSSFCPESLIHSQHLNTIHLAPVARLCAIRVYKSSAACVRRRPGALDAWSGLGHGTDLAPDPQPELTLPVTNP